MIHPDLRFEGFDSRSWTNLLSLFAPGVVERRERETATTDAPDMEAPDPAHPTGSLLVVVDEDDHVIMGLHTARGRIRHAGVTPDPQTLCAMYGARRCAVIREGALEELTERIALRIGPDDDYLEQWLAVLATVREMRDGGVLRVWPQRFMNVPIPPAAAVRRAMDLVLPENRVGVMALWRSGHLWTTIAVRRREGNVDWVIGPDLIGHWCDGTLEGDFRDQAPRVLRAVNDRMGPVHVGLFAELRTVRRLLRGGEPGGWASAVADREVMLQPMPPYVAMGLGADVLRAVARSSSRLLGDRFDVGAFVEPLAEMVRDGMGRARSMTQVLGFDPLELLSRYLGGRPGPEEDDTSG